MWWLLCLPDYLLGLFLCLPPPPPHHSSMSRTVQVLAQHLRHSETEVTCDGCFACHTFSSVLSFFLFFHSSVSRTVQVAPQTPQHLRHSETEVTYDGFFACHTFCSVFFLFVTRACPGQCIHASLQRRMSWNIVTCQSECPSPLVICCGKFMESVSVMARGVRLSPPASGIHSFGKREHSALFGCGNQSMLKGFLNHLLQLIA